MKARLAVGAVLGAVVLIVLAAVPSNALNRIREWPRGSVANIVAKESGVPQARAHGTWKVRDTSNGTRSISSAKVQDLRPGGNSAFVELRTQSNSGICASPEYTSCTKKWYHYKSDQTRRTNSDRWVSLSASTSVDQADSFTRGVMKVCEDQRLSPDPCSGYTYTYGDKY